MTKALIVFLFATTLALGTVSASAQTQTLPGAPSAPDAGGQRGPLGYGWGPGMMMGPGSIAGRRDSADMCDPRAAGFSEWPDVIEQIERAVPPTDAQKASFDQLRTASTKAAEAVADVCPKKRLEAMPQAVKTFPHAFDAFYASLSDDQKSRLDAAGPPPAGGRGGGATTDDPKSRTYGCFDPPELE
jgi:hypothetical protein